MAFATTHGIVAKGLVPTSFLIRIVNAALSVMDFIGASLLPNFWDFWSLVPSIRRPQQRQSCEYACYPWAKLEHHLLACFRAIPNETTPVDFEKLAISDNWFPAWSA